MLLERKQNKFREILKYNCCHLIDGFKQVVGNYILETFSPVVDYFTVYMLICMPLVFVGRCFIVGAYADSHEETYAKFSTYCPSDICYGYHDAGGVYHCLFQARINMAQDSS